MRPRNRAIAAVLAEGPLWLAAVLLGMRAFQACRYLWQRVREWLGEPPATCGPGDGA